MFSPDIVCSEEFLEMPPSSRELYFQLGMRADDDGFIQPKSVIRGVGAKEDDLKVLIAKRFVLPFDSGVVVIKHWLIHNMIRLDRYKPTRFQEEKNSLYLKENKAYTDNREHGTMLLATSWQPNGNHPAPQVRLGKVNNSGEAELRVVVTEEEDKPARVKKDTAYLEIFLLWGSSYPLNWRVNRTEVAAAKHVLIEHGLENAQIALSAYQKFKDDPYCPQILKPSDLDRKWGDLRAFLRKQ